MIGNPQATILHIPNRAWRHGCTQSLNHVIMQSCNSPLPQFPKPIIPLFIITLYMHPFLQCVTGRNMNFFIQMLIGIVHLLPVYFVLSKVL